MHVAKATAKSPGLKASAGHGELSATQVSRAQVPGSSVPATHALRKTSTSEAWGCESQLPSCLQSVDGGVGHGIRTHPDLRERPGRGTPSIPSPHGRPASSQHENAFLPKRGPPPPLGAGGTPPFPAQSRTSRGNVVRETTPRAHTAPHHLPECSFRSFSHQCPWHAVRHTASLQPCPCPRRAATAPQDTPRAPPRNSSPFGAVPSCPLSLERKSLC